MIAKPWLNALLLLGLVTLSTAGAARRSTSCVVSRGAARQVASLEGEAGRTPDNAATVQALASALLREGEPGLAVSVLERAPGSVQSSPAVADVAASAYLNAGRSRESLAMTQRVLSLCEASGCDATLLARTVRRESLIEAILDMGIEDAPANPEAVELAYRKTNRQVRIAMN